MLKLQLMINLALELLCKSQISTYITAKTNLNKALIMQGLDMKMISLNGCVSLITPLTNSEGWCFPRYKKDLVFLNIILT